MNVPDIAEGLAFHYGMLGYYSQSTIDQLLNRFQLVKIPTGKFEKAFMYVKRYPKDFLKKQQAVQEGQSVYSRLNQAKGGSKSVGKVVIGTKPMPQGKTISVKTFENPMQKKETTNPQADTKKVTQKIADNFPENRTALAVNFDKQYTEDMVKRVFSVMGQVRRVYSGAVGKRNESGGK